MAIDIDKLTEAELVDLHNRVVARLNFLQQMRAHSQMLDFSIGERVSFTPDGHPPIIGVVSKYNRKTVSLVTEHGQRWNVSPALLRKISPKSQGTGPISAQVINLPKK